MEKKKKSGAGLAFVVLAAAVKLIMKAGDSKISISLLYLAALAALLLGAYWVFTRLKGGSDQGEFRLDGKSGLRGNSPASSDLRRRPKARTEFNRSQAAAPAENALSRGKEQWKSLYEAGLIDREEYRERLNQMEIRG